MARKNKNFKALVRQRMRKTGESYQVARLQVANSLSRKNQGRIAQELPEVTLAPVQREPAKEAQRKPSPGSDGAPRALDITSLIRLAEVRMASSAMNADAGVPSQLMFDPAKIAAEANLAAQSAIDALSGAADLLNVLPAGQKRAYLAATALFRSRMARERRAR